MTTEDQHPESTGTTRGVEPSTEQAGSSTLRTGSTTGETRSSTAETGPSTGETAPTTEGARSSTDDVGSPTVGTHASTAESESPTRESLFVEDELSGLRSRWDEVQAGFVDDPRECVRKADGLVSDVVDRLTSGFADARSRLEEQWSRGEEASTEDLRVALKRYREFFQRLLAV